MKKILYELGVAGLLLLAQTASAYEQADLDTLLATNECRRCDLSNAPLAGKKFNKAVLEGANLKGADLKGASLRMADLAGVDLQGADLRLAVLEAADMFGANLVGAKLDGATLDGAYLVGVRFEEGAEPVAAPVKKVAKVVPTEKREVPPPAVQETALPASAVKEAEPKSDDMVALKPAPVPQPRDQAAGKVVVAEESLLEEKRALAPAPPPPAPKGVAGDSSPGEALPVDVDAPPMLAVSGRELLQKAQAETAEAPVVSLDQSALLEKLLETNMCVGCDFSGMDLQKLKLKGAFLERVNFEGANLRGVNFTGANLKAANLRNANLQNADLEGADLYKADLEGADLTDVDLEETLLDGAYLGNANLAGVNLEELRQ